MTARYVHIDWEPLIPVAEALDLFEQGIDPRATQSATHGAAAYLAAQPISDNPIGER